VRGQVATSIGPTPGLRIDPTSILARGREAILIALAILRTTACVLGAAGRRKGTLITFWIFLAVVVGQARVHRLAPALQRRAGCWRVARLRSFCTIIPLRSLAVAKAVYALVVKAAAGRDKVVAASKFGQATTRGQFDPAKAAVASNALVVEIDLAVVEIALAAAVIAQIDLAVVEIVRFARVTTLGRIVPAKVAAASNGSPAIGLIIARTAFPIAIAGTIGDTTRGTMCGTIGTITGMTGITGTTTTGGTIIT